MQISSFAILLCQIGVVAGSRGLHAEAAAEHEQRGRDQQRDKCAGGQFEPPAVIAARGGIELEIAKQRADQPQHHAGQRAGIDQPMIGLAQARRSSIARRASSLNSTSTCVS